MEEKKNPAAVALGRAGGLARAKNLTDKRRHLIAKKAAKASARVRTKRAKQKKAQL
jgi:hypothetical protein